ncbi:hypothetical protein OIU78_019513 [Salix suchowensis]|nr:hypothetical protein OIU78_019513 [Salix suchowensis]
MRFARLYEFVWTFNFIGPERSAAKESRETEYILFFAIVGQDEMKLCLLLNVIDPKIGGVMIMGDRGTGKSTTVRSHGRFTI